jgi:hypothetical protein
MGLRRATSCLIIHTDLHKPNNKLINAKSEHFWCMDKPQTNTNSQDSARPKVGEATTFPLIIYYVPSHKTNTQMSFCPEFPKLGLSQLWRPITLCAYLLLRWGLKQSCNFRWEFSNGMWHAMYMQGNHGDSWHATYTQGSHDDSQLLVVGNQIGNLTSGLSFGHNLCFNYPNGSCKPILDIYVPITFEWYKELFNPMGFDPCNCTLRFESPSRFQFPKWDFTWECGGSFPHTFHTLRSMKCDS